jgi:thioredoxin-related protein
MPGIESLYSQTTNEQNAFILISLDDDFETAKAWVAKKGFKAPIYYTKELPELFQVGSIPTTFIFNKNGKIIFKAVGGDNYNTPRFQKMMRG